MVQVLPDLIRFWDTLFSVECGERQAFFVAASVACVLVANNEGLLVYNDFADIMRNLQRGLQVCMCRLPRNRRRCSGSNRGALFGTKLLRMRIGQRRASRRINST
jgi:hypothetical protein